MKNKRLIVILATFAACLILLWVVFLIVKHTDFAAGGEGAEASDTTAAELTLGELPDYSDAHAEDAPYLVFSSDLEPISSERIEKVRDAFYRLLYRTEYDIQSELLKDTGLDEDAVFEKAHNLATQHASSYKSTLMNPDNLLYDDSYTYVCRFVSRYYGTVGGCEIIAFHSFVEKETVLELGGVTIEDAHPFHILVCKEKELITLAEAYEKEWLTPSDILLIAKRNSDFNAYWEEYYSERVVEYSYVRFVDDLEDISDEMFDEIKLCMYGDKSYETRFSEIVSNYTEKYGELYSKEKLEGISALWATRSMQAVHDTFMRNANTDSIGWRYYGIIDGYVVFAEVDTTDSGKRYKLGDYTVSFGNGAKMWVYRSDAGIVELDDAYAGGMLTDAAVARICERHIAYIDYVYNKNNG